MKIKALVLSVAVVATVLTGCGKAADTTAPKTDSKPAASTTTDKKADATTTASIVDNKDAFLKAVAKDGKWIIAITKDLTVDKEIVVDGDFKNGKKDDKGVETLQRKIALYTQDDNHVVTGRFTLTAPKITFNSVNGSIEHGTFKGDVYVAGKNFKLVNATIQGNIYFLNQEAMDTFKIADVAADKDKVATTVSGVKELKK